MNLKSSCFFIVPAFLTISAPALAFDPTEEMIRRGEWPSGAYKIDLKNNKMVDENGKEFPLAPIQKELEEEAKRSAKLKKSLDFSELEHYVTRLNLGGMTYEGMREFEGQPLTRVKDMMVDRQWAQHWAQMAFAIGALGGDGEIEFLINYIETFNDSSDAAFDAKSASLEALGYLSARSKNEKALDYLLEASDPQKASLIAAPYSKGGFKAAQSLIISSALGGLATTGSDRAIEALSTKANRIAKLRHEPMSSETGTRDLTDMQALITRAEQVKRNGLMADSASDEQFEDVFVVP